MQAHFGPTALYRKRRPAKAFKIRKIKQTLQEIGLECIRNGVHTYIFYMYCHIMSELKVLLRDQLGVNRIVVRAVHVAAHLAAFDADRATHEDPVEGHCNCVRPFDSFARGTMESHLFQFVQVHRWQVFRIQIATEDCPGTCRIPLQIGQHFVKLGGLDGSETAALQMRVVHNQQPTGKLQLSNECDAAPEAALKER